MGRTQDGAEQLCFQAGHAAGRQWSAVTRAAFADIGGPEPGVNLGFVYVSDAFAGQFDQMVALLRELSGIAHWVGTVGMGVIGGRREYFGEPAVSVMIAAIPPDAFRVVSVPNGSTLEIGPALHRWIDQARPALGVMHADPRCDNLADVLGDIAERTGAFLVGGLASSDGGMPQVADKVTEGGASGVLFASSMTVATGLSQGCTPIGATHTVTEAMRNIVITLDSRPALDVLLGDAELTADDDIAHALGPIHVALPVPGDTGDYLVRNLIGIDPNAGAVGIAALPDPGDRLMFVRRDAAAAETDLRRMLREIKARAGGDIAGAIYVSCLARGPNLFAEPSQEVGIIADELGDVPLVGFFANGELSNARLYGYTGVLTLFTRGTSASA